MSGIKRADVARLAVMAVHGGVYLDLDVQCPLPSWAVRSCMRSLSQNHEKGSHSRRNVNIVKNSLFAIFGHTRHFSYRYCRSHIGSGCGAALFHAAVGSAASMAALFLVNRSRASECEAAACEAGLRPIFATTTQEAMSMLQTSDLRAVVCALGTDGDHIDSGWPILRECQERFPTVFCAVLSCTADRDARIRLKCFAAGAMMVTHSVDSIQEALSLVVAQWSSGLNVRGTGIVGTSYFYISLVLGSIDADLCK